MRRYILDTTPLAAYLFGRAWAVGAINPWIDQDEVATSIVVYGEVVEYLRRLPDFDRHHAQLRQQLREIRPYALTYAIMERYADIRLTMRQGRLIGDVDTLIAATSLEHDLIVVTTDQDFQRVPNLRVLLLSRAP